MVLTNFECWAADGSSPLPSSAASLEFETSRHLNPFDPRVVTHVPSTNITHLSSNGYYGFSYINSAHEVEPNNNNNVDIINNNNNDLNRSHNNNNNTTAHNFMANDVNGMNNTTSQQQQPTHVYANFVHRTAEPPPAGTTSRCKKRFFVVCDDDADVNVKCTADGDFFQNHTNASAKRCRFDDDFAAQYCNDFFSLPSTQIATQSCLMDTEEGTTPQHHQQQQQQQQPQQLHQNQHHHKQVVVDEAMFENNNNNNNCVNNNNNIEKYEQSILHQQLQHQQQQQQSQLLHTHQPPTTLQQQQEQLYHHEQQQQQHDHAQQQQQHPYHQQQHYQDMNINTNTHHQQTPCLYNLQHHNHHHHHDHRYHLNRILCDTWPHSKSPYSKDNIYENNLRYSNKIQINKRNNQDDVDFEDKYNNDDCKIDDATLFSQLHGGSWQHFNESTSHN